MSEATLIIGLEVHVQLKTASKLFCRCPTQFGAEPNSQTCPVCLGLPGSLPVMNRRAFELGMKTAAALQCRIAPFTKWDRKNYYYPDLPKGYQISQYDLPLAEEGYLEIEDLDQEDASLKVRVQRAHLEEDAGKSMHDEDGGQADSRIDLNRTGTPLMEIVTHPDLRSPAQARVFLNELKLLLGYLDVSDCNMQEGSLRVDANVNLHVPVEGETVATPIVEIKNLNSFRAVESALQFESRRQWQQWRDTGQRMGDVPKETRGWDERALETRGQRRKEESSDYRYFPDPDLVPVRVSDEDRATVRRSLEQSPSAWRERLRMEHQLSAYDAGVLVSQGRPFVEYYCRLAAAVGDGKRTCNWMQQDVLRTLREREVEIDAFPVPFDELVILLRDVGTGKLDNTRARELFGFLVEQGGTVSDARRALGVVEVDDDELEQLCRELLRDHPNVVADVRQGKTKALGALIGEARRRNRNVNPGELRARLEALIEGDDST